MTSNSIELTPPLTRKCWYTCKATQYEQVSCQTMLPWTTIPQSCIILHTIVNNEYWHCLNVPIRVPSFGQRVAMMVWLPGWLIFDFHNFDDKPSIRHEYGTVSGLRPQLIRCHLGLLFTSTRVVLVISIVCLSQASGLRPQLKSPYATLITFFF
jgi:hypothetical protein